MKWTKKHKEETGFLSWEEFLFSHWLNDNKAIDSWNYENLKYDINDSIRYNGKVVYRKSSYSPDFEIFWKDPSVANACGIWHHNGRSIIEIKPDYDFQNMERAVKMKCIIVHLLHGDLIQIIHTKKLFKETYMPIRGFYTYTGKKRRLKEKFNTYENFIKKRRRSV